MLTRNTDITSFLEQLESWHIALFSAVLIFLLLTAGCISYCIFRAMFGQVIYHITDIENRPDEIVHIDTRHRRHRKSSRPARKRKSPKRRFREEIEQQLDDQNSDDRSSKDEITNEGGGGGGVHEEESEGRRKRRRGERGGGGGGSVRKGGEELLRIKSDQINTIQSIVSKLRPTPSTMQTLLDTDQRVPTKPLFIN